jgi:hypothetical protein
MSTRKVVILGFVVVILWACSLMVIYDNMSRNTSRAAPVPTVAPTAVTVLEPIELPVIEPTTVVDMTELTYIAELLTWVRNYTAQLQTIADLVQQWSENKSVVNNMAWLNQLDASIAVLKFSGTQVRGMTAPARFVTMQRELEDATRYYDQAMDDMLVGVVGNDPSVLLRALGMMNMGNEAMGRAQTELNKASATIE